MGCAKVQFAGLGNWLAPHCLGLLGRWIFLYKANASLNEESAGFISKPLASMSPENVPGAGLAWEKPGAQCKVVGLASCWDGSPASPWVWWLVCDMALLL